MATDQYGKKIIYSEAESESISANVVLQDAKISVSREKNEIRDISGKTVSVSAYDESASLSATCYRTAETTVEAMRSEVETWLKEKCVSLGGLTDGGTVIWDSMEVSLASASAVSYSISATYRPYVVTE